ncbi:hypothetical protein [Desulfovibrio sp. JC022]|uniref:hypothetical protein n=1 Tax=Desulfovibrio sp. JC022 TaxID=2593642 RepID=UPI0013D5FA3D|nr:hypothetical protein [Desulfovibrio sp. JC022]NDV24973.1 hypothetical protein [Desulfovibrio sp. JC022]
MLNRITILGWITVLYSGISVILGLCSLFPLWKMFTFNIFKSTIHALVYFIIWLTIYLVPAMMLFKIIISKNNKHLLKYATLWFLGTFLLVPLYITTSRGEEDLGAGFLVGIYSMTLQPYLCLIGLGELGLLLLLIPPLFNLYLVFVAWKRPQWFYKE